jgi:hypothetical protein
MFILEGIEVKPKRSVKRKTDAARLRACIKKWQFIAKMCKDHRGRINDGGSDTCSLCATYLDHDKPEESRCKGCPVFNVTNKRYCEKTPYETYDTADTNGLWKTRFAAANAMVTFLKELLSDC